MSEILNETITQSGLLDSSKCLVCDVCCRFPEADTPLAPFFSQQERDNALDAGLPKETFLPGRYGAGQQARFLDEDAVREAERRVAVVRKRYDAVDARRAAPPLLREGKVHTHREDDDILAQVRRLLVEAARFDRAHLRIQRRYGSDDPNFPPVR